jgi:hypothetical protein
VHPKNYRFYISIFRIVQCIQKNLMPVLAKKYFQNETFCVVLEPSGVERMVMPFFKSFIGGKKSKF